MKEIFIIRHGQTEHNRKGIVQGKGINLPLNDTGLKQASLFSKAYGDVDFDVVYTSTLLRAQETVSFFIQKGIKHIIAAALDEISWGSLEGQNQTMEDSKEFHDLIKEWENGNVEISAPNGESPLDVQKRQQPFIDAIINSNDKKILVCMHGRAMRVLLCTLMKTSLSKMQTFEHANLTLYKLHLHSNNNIEVVLHNDQQHLHA